MDRRVNPWLVLTGAFVLLVLGVDLWLSFRDTKALREDSALVDHTHQVMLGLERVPTLVQQAETNKRGSLLTGDPRFLARYRNAVAAARAQLDSVAVLTSDNAVQQARVPALRQRVEAKIAEMDRVLTVRDSLGLESARQAVLADAAGLEFDNVRVLVDSMSAHERSLLAVRSARSDATYRKAVRGGALSGALAFLAVFGFFLVLRRHLAERQRTAATIAEQGERLRTTLASIGDAVITTDLESRVTSLNPVAEQITGWRSGEAAGRPVEEIFRIVNERTGKTAPNPVRRALAEGAIVGLANHTKLVARDGTERPIEDSAAPIRGEDGAILGCVLVFRDVTEQRAAGYALAESEERLQLAARAADLGSWVWDVREDRLRADDRLAFLYGLPTEDLVRGVPIERGFERVDPRDIEQVRADVERAIETGGTFDTTYRMRGRDDVERWLRAHGRVELDEDGKPFRMAGAVLDITESRRLERERQEAVDSLKDADRRKDEFLATLAHELRNPLAPIRNCLQILSVTRDGAQADAARAMMERQLGQMVGLIDDLLDLSRISQGKIELRRERAELARLVLDAVETERPAIAQAGLTVRLSVPERPVYVDVDVTRLAQVLTNLLTNAVKYTERGGAIDVVVGENEIEACVEVRDTGIGIPAAMLPRIFDMFTQVEGSIERSQGGLGIGLWLVRRLAELHGGRVEAKSEGPGRGSAFIACLPLVRDGVGTTASRPRAGAGAERVARKILVVDDNRDSATSLALMLQLMGNETRTAHDGIEGLETAAAFRPDVVLLDLGMPRLNGYDTAQRMREQPWGRDVILVALTGWGQESDRKRSRDAGFDHHLVKPVEPALLERLLAESARR
jgi:PAS domain S-box-containing protein